MNNYPEPPGCRVAALEAKAESARRRAAMWCGSVVADIVAELVLTQDDGRGVFIATGIVAGVLSACFAAVEAIEYVKNSQQATLLKSEAE